MTYFTVTFIITVHNLKLLIADIYIFLIERQLHGYRHASSARFDFVICKVPGIF